mmetsp:Transcript_18711/g.52050  ORF Transcript_18711/g.52050 Transcript_18711/m.52050 type:complete len:140 (+) Transcript_18711:470-889(+)
MSSDDLGGDVHSPSRFTFIVASSTIINATTIPSTTTTTTTTNTMAIPASTTAATVTTHNNLIASRHHRQHGRQSWMLLFAHDPSQDQFSCKRSLLCTTCPCRTHKAASDTGCGTRARVRGRQQSAHLLHSTPLYTILFS